MTPDERKELIQEAKQYFDAVDSYVVESITPEEVEKRLEALMNKVEKFNSMQPYPECEATEHDFESKGCICLDKWLEEMRGDREETGNRLGEQTTN